MPNIFGLSGLMHTFRVQGGNDLQTEADRKAQRCIVNTLANRFPDMTIYGEEVNVAACK